MLRYVKNMRAFYFILACVSYRALFFKSSFSYLPSCEAKRDTYDQMWTPSQNLSKWYTPFDLCMIHSTSNASYENIIEDCKKKIEKDQNMSYLPPIRCTAGNSWPSKSTFCSAEDLPFSNRSHFQHAMAGYDDPSSRPLASFFSKLQRERGALLLIGDSVTQQFFGGLACELEREGLWTDTRKFTNTDDTQFVRITDMTTTGTGGSAGNEPWSSEASRHSVPVRFLPVYHMVNGRWDRVPNANFERLKSALEEWTSQPGVRSLVILINMGLHYVDNPVKDFTPQDYESHMTMVLSYLHKFVQSQEDKLAQQAVATSAPDSAPITPTVGTKLRVLWRETSAQHFPTPNGYWPGQRYSHTMRLACVPVQDSTPPADWRNRIVEKIIKQRRLFHIRVVRFYRATLPLFSEHPNGRLKDCTHFCWTPMLYQSVFHDMDRHMNR